MSFGGGGSQQYFIDYIIRVKNEGTGGAGAFSQINQGMKQTQMGAVNVTHAMERMSATNQKVIQAGQGISKAMKGMAFGFLGLTTAGAEFFGMMSMWKATQQGVKEAQENANKALAEGGKNSKEYKDAMMDVAKANRWAQMTFRNLMLSAFDLVPFFVLSVNGIIKLRSAYKLLREAQLEQKAMKEVMAAAGIKEAAAANLSTASYGSLTKAQRLLKAEQALGISTLNAKTTATNVATAANVSHNGSLITQIPLLGKQAKATDVVAASTTRLTKAMRVLQIAMKIAIPLVIIEIASQAFQNNWGGFADKVNALGKAFGDAVPFMRGFLDIIGKIGRSIAAIFTGNFEDVKSIWEGSTEAQKENTEITESQQKAYDELQEAMNASATAGADLISEFADMDNKARKTFLFEHGIKGGAKDRFKDVALGLDKLRDTFSKFGEDLQLIKLDEKLGNWFDLPKSFYKKVGFTMEDRFKDLGKELGDKGLTNLGEEFRKAAKSGKGYEAYKQAVLNAVKFDPTLMSKLKVLDPEAYAEFKQILDEEKQKLAGIVNEVFDPKDNSLWQYNDDTALGEGESLLGRNHNKQGMFGGLIESLKSGAQQLGIEIDAVNWTELGAKVRTGLETVFTVENAQQLGGWIKLHLINPVMTALQEQLKPVVEAFSKDPIGYIVGAVNAISDIPAAFIAGLFGFKSAADMEKKLKGALYAFFNEVPVLQELRKIINNPIGYLTQVLTGGAAARGDIIAGAAGFAGAEASTFPERGRAPHILIRSAQDVADQLGITDFFAKVDEAWAAVQKIVNDTGAGIAEFLKDPIGWFLKQVRSGTPGDPNGPGGANESLDLNELGIDKAVKDIIGKIQSAFNMQTAEGVEVEIKVIPNFSLQKALATPGRAPSRFEGGMSPSEAIQKVLGGKKWQAPHTMDPVTLENVPAVVGTYKIALGNTDENFAPETSVNEPMIGSTVDGSTLPPIELTGKIVSIDTTAMVEVLKTVNETFGNTMLQLADMWQKTMVAMGGMADIAVDAIGGVFANLGATMESQFNATEVNWNNATTNILSDAQSASEQIQEEFQTMNEQLEEEFNAMEENWNNAMSNMESDASSAVSNILNDLEKLNTTFTTTHKVVTERVTKTTRLAKGGAFITSGTENIIVGDNPGGRELVTATPLSSANVNGPNLNIGNPAATTFNGTVNLNISGNEIINKKKLKKIVRMSLGQRMDRFGS